MLGQLTGAAVRAGLVMVLIAMPSVLLPGTGTDGRQMVALVAVVAGALVFVEYATSCPVLIEFRHAPPYNRIRYAMLFAMVFILSLTLREGVAPSTLGALLAAVAQLCGVTLDFPYSPVRLVTILLAQGAPPETAGLIRAAAGAAYLTALVGLAGFVLVMRTQAWPFGAGAFNVWLNLPTFDPTAGGDVVARLERDARINLALGFLLPFVIPALIEAGGMALGKVDPTFPQTLVWMIAAWAFLPALLAMRGIAMARIAATIRARRRHGLGPDAPGYLAA